MRKKGDPEKKEQNRKKLSSEKTTDFGTTRKESNLVFAKPTTNKKNDYGVRTPCHLKRRRGPPPLSHNTIINLVIVKKRKTLPKKKKTLK